MTPAQDPQQCVPNLMATPELIGYYANVSCLMAQGSRLMLVMSIEPRALKHSSFFVVPRPTHHHACGGTPAEAS